MQLFEYGKAFTGGTYIGFNFPAEPVIICGQRHLYDTFGFRMDFLQQIYVPENTIGFCDNSKAKTILVNQLQNTAECAKLHFQRNIGICHGTCANHAWLSFGFQCSFQQFHCIFLYLDVFKWMLHMIAPASGITVNTSVGTPAINIHSIMRR